MELIYLLSNIMNISVWWMIVIITCYYIPTFIYPHTNKDKYKSIKLILFSIVISILIVILSKCKFFSFNKIDRKFTLLNFIILIIFTFIAFTLSILHRNTNMQMKHLHVTLTINVLNKYVINYKHLYPIVGANINLNTSDKNTTNVDTIGQ